MEIIKNLTLSETMKGIKVELMKRYPESCFVYFACEPIPGSKNKRASYGEYGDPSDIQDMGIDLVQYDNRAKKFCRDTTLSEMANLRPEDFNHEIPARLHDAMLDYAIFLGTPIKGQYCRDHPKFRSLLTEQNNKYVHKMGQSVKMEELEIHISELKEEINRLEKLRSPLNMYMLIESEIKRLNKAGKIEEAKSRKEELENIKEKHRKSAELKNKRIEQCAKMRQAKEKKKEQLVQAEKDRNRQQFQPGQAAKKKMKKIRERQAERKASKKKASENSQYFNRPISDVIAERR